MHVYCILAASRLNAVDSAGGGNGLGAMSVDDLVGRAEQQPIVGLFQFS